MKPTLNHSRENQRLLSLRQKHHRAHPTHAEEIIRDLLSSLNERFIFQKGFFTSYRFFIVDFYLPKRRKLCLEIDGLIHADQVAYDASRDHFLTKVRGFRVLRITNDHAESMTGAQLLNLIR